MNTLALLAKFAPEIVCKRHYRADIDGLRGIAILAVVLYHFFPQFFPAGFVGVDIFFVISGYLIINIIHSSLEKGTFSYLTFYSHRIRRLFPSLLLVLLFIFCFSWIYFLPSEFTTLGKHIFGGIFFIDNILFVKDANYFNPLSQDNILLHLWSLGVEEQFYIIVPIFMAGICIMSKKLVHGARQGDALLIFLCVSAFASFCCQQYLLPASEKAFYFPHARYWEIGCGGVLALLEKKDSVASLFARCSLPLALLGVLLLLAGFLLIRKQYFPGAWALLPVLGTFCCIAAGSHGNFLNTKLLSHPVLIFLGIISYPLYLWHWPIITLLRLFDAASLTARCAFCLLAIVAAAATFRLVERPLRFMLSPKKAVAALIVAACIVAGMGLLTKYGRITPSTADRWGEISQVFGDWLIPKKEKYNDVLVDGHVPGKKYTLLYGDSFAQQYFPRAAAVVQAHPDLQRGIILIHGIRYPAYRGSRFINIHGYDTVFDRFIKIANLDDVDTVVLSGIWKNCFSSQDAQITLDGVHVHPKRDRKKIMQRWEEILHFLKEKEKNIYIIFTNPHFARNGNNGIIERNFYPRSFSIKNERIDCQRFKNMYKDTYEWVRSLAAKYGAHFIDPADYLCRDGYAPTVDEEGKLIYIYNRDHFRAGYMREKITYLDDAFLGK